MRLVLVCALLLAACSSPRQLVVVTTPDWSAVDGTLRMYERAGSSWRQVGADVPVVVGRRGLAPLGEKKEGDGRSPSGRLAIGPAFGFAPTSDLRLPYRPLLETTECVDDVNSRFYNAIMERDADADWQSSEKMRHVDQYRLGAVLQHNPKGQPGKGSCIFLHIWTAPSHGTAGCTAMPESDLTRLLHWLDPAAHPDLVQLPSAEYERVKGGWGLP
ncbi:MAG TPA: L,D-transpeptidase family protein [Thermoanaerobaculia bacterium]|jgi:L,D-peptidoglycan transpeptidase YkuD (ErfK/YbiS/YcfS/YnhG family)|nr:L,D-transpeptidase family protein [Thermoanaerobaculia bacterium]